MPTSLAWVSTGTCQLHAMWRGSWGQINQNSVQGLLAISVEGLGCVGLPQWSLSNSWNRSRGVYNASDKKFFVGMVRKISVCGNNYAYFVSF